MSDHITAVPLTLALPLGVLAEHVAGSDPPQYTVAGEPIAVDVMIPDGLVALGWHWNGSFLHWRGDGPAGQLMVSTDLHPPPGWPSERRDCFAVARAFDLTMPAPVAVKPAQKAKRTAEPHYLAAPQSAAPMQLTLFEEATYA